MSDIDMDAPDQDSPKNLREFAEQANARAREAEEQMRELQRRETFRDAGLDPKNPLHSALIKGYDGEITEDAVTKFVSTLGLDQAAGPQGTTSIETAPSPAPVTEGLSPEEIAAHDRMAGISRGSDGFPVPAGDEAYADELRGIIAQAKAEGWPKDRLDRTYSNAVMAHNGADSVVWNGVPYEPH